MWGKTMYADDVAEIELASMPGKVYTPRHFHTTRSSNIHPHGLAQYEDKAEYVLTFHGDGAARATRIVMRGGEAAAPHQLTQVATYLGNYHDTKGRIATTIDI